MKKTGLRRSPKKQTEETSSKAEVVAEEEIVLPKIEQVTLVEEEQVHPEQEYVTLVQKILKNGRMKPTRTPVPAKSLNAHLIRFPLTWDLFPLLTTKKVFFNGVLEELCWFIKGQTDNSILVNNGVRIWSADTSAESLAAINSPLKPGDAGAIYGWQWRHWSAEYQDCKTDYTGQGVDQLANLFENLIKDRESGTFSRRLLVSAWNPKDFGFMAIPPCHFCFQIYTEPGLNPEDKPRLSLIWFQRSVDVMLGLPFNISSYAALMLLICYVCDYEPFEIVGQLGDTHIYENHIENAKVLIQREPKPWPKCSIVGIDEEMQELIKKRDFDSFFNKITPKNFCIEGYDPHPFLSFPINTQKLK